MRTLLMAILGLVLAVLLSPAAAVARDAATLEVEGEIVFIDPGAATARPPFPPGDVLLELVEDRPEGAPEVPGKMFETLYGSWEFQGNPVHLALCWSTEEAKGYDLLFIDLDGDGTFGEGERHEMKVESRATRSGTVATRGSVRDLSITVGERKWPFLVAWQKRPTHPLMARVISLWYLHGKVKVDEKMFAIDVMDGDVDGSFSGEEDHWLLRGDGPVMAPTKRPALSAPTEQRFFSKELFALNGIKGTTMNVTHGPADGPDPASQAAHRERVERACAEQFDQEREGFIRQFGVDPDRARTKTPIVWRYVTFDQAQAMAKEEGKPLFVDLMAFWCLWSWRMGYYTYPDAEVAELLGTKFIPVRILEEQDFAGDHGRLRTLLGAAGLPAMGVWGPDGKLRGFISGWKKAEEFLALLEKALLEPEEK